MIPIFNKNQKIAFETTLKHVTSEGFFTIANNKKWRERKPFLLKDFAWSL